MQHLFVYGTLAPNRPNHHIMTPIHGTWQTAHITGRLHEAGWGATHGYPALIPADDGDVIDGFVFSSDELDAHWQRLDEFEGVEYARILVDATLDDGQVLKAYVYALNPVIVERVL